MVVRSRSTAFRPAWRSWLSASARSQPRYVGHLHTLDAGRDGDRDGRALVDARASRRILADHVALVDVLGLLFAHGRVEASVAQLLLGGLAREARHVGHRHLLRSAAHQQPHARALLDVLALAGHGADGDPLAHRIRVLGIDDHLQAGAVELRARPASRTGWRPAARARSPGPGGDLERDRRALVGLRRPDSGPGRSPGPAAARSGPGSRRPRSRAAPATPAPAAAACRPRAAPRPARWRAGR